MAAMAELRALTIVSNSAEADGETGGRQDRNV